MTAPNTPRGSYGLLTWCLAVGGLGAIPASPGRAPRDRVWGERRGPTQPAVTAEPTAARPPPPPTTPATSPEQRGGEARGPRLGLPPKSESSRPDTLLRPRPVPPAGLWARRRARTPSPGEEPPRPAHSESPRAGAPDFAASGPHGAPASSSRPRCRPSSRQF